MLATPFLLDPIRSVSSPIPIYGLLNENGYLCQYVRLASPLRSL